MSKLMRMNYVPWHSRDDADLENVSRVNRKEEPSLSVRNKFIHRHSTLDISTEVV